VEEGEAEIDPHAVVDAELVPTKSEGDMVNDKEVDSHALDVVD